MAIDPYTRSEEIYPRLTAEMIARLAHYGTTRDVLNEDVLFERGQRLVDFFVVLTGSIVILEPTPSGGHDVVTVLRQYEFSGELDLFSDRTNLVTARAGANTSVIRIDRADFNRLLAAEPDIAEIITRALILRRMGLIAHGQGGVVVIGPRQSGDTLRLQRFLTSNGYPHRVVDSDICSDVVGLIKRLDFKESTLPVVVAPDQPTLFNPSNSALAEALGLIERIDDHCVYDVAVAGAGPAGLAAAVYAASEGLRTIIVEGAAPGGQAATSSKIENYLGFPNGISGQALAARAQTQAHKFGARLAIPRVAVSLNCEERPFELVLDDGQCVKARTIVVATGARYRKLGVQDYDKYEGHGIHFAATAMEASLCKGLQVVVVGGGNSAGQAAVFLAQTAGHVHLLIRGTGLAATMSHYLVQRITSSAKITLYTESEITELMGEPTLTDATWTNRVTGQSTRCTVGAIFLMIGAKPNTEWLPESLSVDSNGFVLTGVDSGRSGASAFETALAGIYAVGDVRSGSVKRVAAGVGEGSAVVQAIHRYLAGAQLDDCRATVASP
jgi:thioredoxin reductase (NADPH)